MKLVSRSRAALLTLIFAFTTTAFAQYTETILYNFGNPPDAGIPMGPLVADASGSFYGTSLIGGAHNAGAIFEVSPSSSGWTEATLYSFTNGADGASPESGLIFDAAGNLYGTTYVGGSGNGTVFQLAHSSSGWTLNTLYTFSGSSDGGSPVSGLVFDASGNLYGTTLQGGALGAGAVFELVHSSSGWTEQVIHSFTPSTDGELPSGTLVIDAAGNLYGTAQSGGSQSSSICATLLGCGTVFRLSPGTSWTFTVLLTFQGNRGAYPYGGVILDAAGNLYGAAGLGGSCNSSASRGCGVAYKLTPTARGPWKETVIHVFKGFADGSRPLVSLAMDTSGNLFGASSLGTTFSHGAVFEFSPSATGWTFTSLTKFTGTNDGENPMSPIYVEPSGNLISATQGGGSGGLGTIFELSPTAATSASTPDAN